MATQRHVILICDLCKSEDIEKGRLGIATHVHIVDGQATELEACTKCWKPVAEAHEKLVELGRKPGSNRKVA